MTTSGKAGATEPKPQVRSLVFHFDCLLSRIATPAKPDPNSLNKNDSSLGSTLSSQQHQETTVLSARIRLLQTKRCVYGDLVRSPARCSTSTLLILSTWSDLTNHLLGTFGIPENGPLAARSA
ncbi:uncharacterized protein KZ484_000227 [Pholidichthys leucotaenia]